MKRGPRKIVDFQERKARPADSSAADFEPIYSAKIYSIGRGPHQIEDFQERKARPADSSAADFEPIYSAKIYSIGRGPHQIEDFMGKATGGTACSRLEMTAIRRLDLKNKGHIESSKSGRQFGR